MPTKRSRVHPPFKTKYRIDNWPAHDRALAEQGSLTFWISPEAIYGWSAKPSGQRGAQLKFSDLAIETALTLRLIFHLPLRQTEGFVRSIFELTDLNLEVPDHTTLSRRSRSLDIELRHCTPSEPLILILDSSGLSIRGGGKWAAAKHGGRGLRGWRKLHLGVNELGVIVAQRMTTSSSRAPQQPLQGGVCLGGFAARGP